MIINDGGRVPEVASAYLTSVMAVLNTSSYSMYSRLRPKYTSLSFFEASRNTWVTQSVMACLSLDINRMGSFLLTSRACFSSPSTVTLRMPSSGERQVETAILITAPGAHT